MDQHATVVVVSTMRLGDQSLIDYQPITYPGSHSNEDGKNHQQLVCS